MNSTLKIVFEKILIIFSALAFFGFLAILSIKVLNPISTGEIFENIAKGHNNWHITLFVFLGISFYQYYKLKQDFTRNNDGTSKITLTDLIGLISIVGGIVYFISTLLTCFKFYFFLDLISGNFFEHTEKSILRIIFDAVILGGLSMGMTYAMLMITFKVGIFTSGLSLSIALHNYFNGMEFDLSALWNILLETTLSDFWGVIITIVPLILTLFSEKIVSYMINLFSKLF